MLGDVIDGEVRPLYLTGNLMEEFGATPIEGSDCVIMRVKDKLKKQLADNLIDLPEEYALFENYPNPFNPSTTIQYAIPEQSFVKLVVYNLLGEEVSILVNEQKEPGIYEVKFNANQLPSGIYIYRMQTAKATFTKKLMLLK